MNSITQDQQRVGQKIRLFVSLFTCLFLFGYGVLCIIRGYGFGMLVNLRWYTVYVGTDATALGIEYIAWAVTIVTLVLWSNSMGWYSDLMRIIFFFISTAVILWTTWFRWETGGVVIAPVMWITVKLVAIFLFAKWVIQYEV